MDQKKTLWIITASGVFLAVVVLAALIVNKPVSYEHTSVASINPIEAPVSNKVQDTKTLNDQVLSDSSNGSSNDSSLDSSIEDQGVKITLEQDDLNNLQPIDETANNGTSSNKDCVNSENFTQQVTAQTVVINVNKQEDVSPVTAKNQVTLDAMNNNSSNQNIYTTKSVSKSYKETLAENRAKQLNASSNNAKTANVTAKASVTKENVEQAKFWIQCGSYASKKSAELARTTLGENQITAEVFTFKDSKNKLYYRVRVGPYTTKSEAEYWKNRIVSNENFKNSNSYITMN